MKQDYKRVWRMIGEVTGFITILALLVTVLQLLQSKVASDSQDLAQSTLIALLQKQLDVQSEIATLQASSAGLGPTSTVIAERIVDLENTRVALATEEARVKQTPQSNVILARPTDTKPPTTPFICSLAPEIRLQIGNKARITFTSGEKTRLRSAPEGGDNLIATLSEGTELEIIDGPVCYPRPGRSDAYVYWKVHVTTNGLEGWLAEGDADAYYLEPIP
ncbi:SH3 domain-containing protein [bacterium]|nr:SH3 domain-containing protein [bacterium]